MFPFICEHNARMFRNLISNSMDQRILESDESDEEHGEEDEETQAVV